MDEHQSIYFWPITIAAPLLLAIALTLAFRWRRLKPTRESLGSQRVPGSDSAGAAMIWGCFALGGGVTPAILAANWSERLRSESGFLTILEPIGLTVAAVCAATAIVIYLFGWPVALIPPNFRGDTGHITLWWRVLRRRMDRWL